MGRVPSLTPEETQAVQDKIQELIRREGSQGAVGRLLGTSQQAISNAVAGQIGFALARKVARELGVTFEALVGREPVPVPPGARAAAAAARPDYGGLSLQDLVDTVQALAVRQLRDVIDRHPQVGPHSVELAEAAHTLAARLRRAGNDEGAGG